MQPTPTPARKIRWLLLGAFVLQFLFASLLAQDTGSIAGRVFDASSGRSLQGATVRVEGSDRVDYTTVDGRYMISGVPVGPATVHVEYVGLNPLTGTVNVTAGGVTLHNAGLGSAALQMEAVTVSESALGQARAINQQKTASGIINIVSEETFGQMTDGNIGFALQRLPGISVDEDQDGGANEINIRGISSAYNSFQIDGNRAPTSGSSRSFNPRQLAADGVTNIEVIKAPTPDRDGDAIGGIINVVSRSAFQREGRDFRLKIGGTMNDISDKWGHNGSLTYSDLLSVGGGEKNLGVTFTISSYNTDRYSINADMDWIQVTPGNNPTLNLPTDIPVWFMEANHWEYDTRRTHTYGLSGAIDFRTDNQNSFYFRPVFSHYDRSGVKFESDIDIDTRFQDAVGGRKTYASLTENSGRGTPGNSGSRGSRGWIGTADELENDLYSINFGGRHERTEQLLTYDFFLSRSKQVVTSDLELNTLMEPDSPWMVFEYLMHDPDRGEVDINVLNGVDSTDLSLMTEGELIDITSSKTHEIYSARVDWERKFQKARGVFTVKTGAKYRSNDLDFDQTGLVYEMDEDFPYAQVMTPTNRVLMRKPKYFDVHPKNGLALLQSDPSLFELNEEDTIEESNLGDYNATERTAAAYVMGTWQSGRHTVIGGLRYETTKWSSRNKRASYFDGIPSISSVDSSDSYKFWLPGIHFRHELRPNLILRESYNRSYGRPKLDELTMGRFTNEDGDIEDGNPTLRPATSDNFDIQLEYYTQSNGLYSIGFFYKDVKNFSFTEIYNFDDLDANGIPIRDDDGDLEYEHPLNGSTGKNYGWELMGRQRLYFLPGPLKGLSIALSATITESEATYPNRTDNRDLPLEGFSKYLFTATADYAWGNFHARVDYRYRDDYIEGLGDDIESDEYFGEEKKVDAEIGYRFRPGMQIVVSGTNLTNSPLVSYQGYRPFVEDASLNGRKYTVALELEF